MTSCQSAPASTSPSGNLRYLLGTNSVMYVLQLLPVEVLAIFNANASRMTISAITLSELMHGAE
jgi:tRNA(fMet)-specific endonuclease VapC